MFPNSARYVVEIDGTRYDSRRDDGSRVAAVTVELEADLTGEASVTFADPKFTVTDRHLDATGMRHASARVWLGYGEDLGAACFGGRLVGVEHDSLRATLRFHDRTRELKQAKKSRYHNGKTDVEIMRDVAAEYQMGFELVGAAVDSERHESLIQRGLSDWDFVRTLARRAGWRVWADGGTLYAQEMGVGGGGGVTLHYGKDFLFMRPLTLSYKLPENRRGRYKRVAVRTRGTAGELLTGESDGGDERGRVHAGAHVELTHNTRRTAERAARAVRLKSKESAFDCRVRLLPAGGRVIGLRSVVTLKGVGDFFGGDYVVHAMRREWSKGALVDELTLRRDIGKRKPTPAPRRRTRR